MASSVNFDLKTNLATFQTLSERGTSATNIIALRNITDEMRGLIVPQELSQYQQVREMQETLLNNLLEKIELLEINTTSPMKKLMIPVFTGAPETPQPSLPIHIPLSPLPETQTEQPTPPSDTAPLPSIEATEEDHSDTEPLLPPPPTQPQIPILSPIPKTRPYITRSDFQQREEAPTSSFPGLCFLSFLS